MISALVTYSVFVPVAVFLLPDKTRASYSEAFSLLREALEQRGLRLSSFEVAIKQEFVKQFPAVKPKGCSFHIIKVIITKVQKSGFKADYASLLPAWSTVP